MDCNISPVNNCKYLGIYLDNKLTFNDHIKYVNSKISRHTGILYKIRDHLPIKSRLDYYYAYIYPYLSYNVIIWGGTYPIHLQPLIIQQKRTIRTICNAGYRDHTDPLFKRLNLLKFHDGEGRHSLFLFSRFENNDIFRSVNRVKSSKGTVALLLKNCSLLSFST